MFRIIVAVNLLAACSAAQTQYQTVILTPQFLGASRAVAVNNNGQIAGQFGTHAFLWENQTLTDLGTFSVAQSRNALNNLGQVVGSIYVNGSHAAMWQAASGITDLGTLPGGTNLGSWAVAINDAGQIAGTSTLNNNQFRHAVLWQSGTVTDLGALVANGNSEAVAINSAGQVTGWSDSVDGSRHAFIWQNGMMTDLGVTCGSYGARCNSVPTAMNSSGQIVGYSYVPNLSFPTLYDIQSAVLWTPGGGGTYQAIDIGGLDYSPFIGKSAALAINGQGLIVGESSGRPSWSSGQPGGMYPVDASIALGSARDVNSSGRIAGDFAPSLQFPHIQHAFSWQYGQPFSDIRYPDGLFIRVSAMNDSGWIVGENLAGYAYLWVPDRPPVADATATAAKVISPNNVTAPVLLDGSKSTDPDGDPLTYRWFVDGSTFSGLIGTGVTLKVEFSLGDTRLRLEVNDGWATSSTDFTVTVVTAAQAVTDVLAQVSAANIPNGVKNTLSGDLNAAINSFNKGNFKAGVNQLQTFISDVNAQTGKKIDAVTAGALIASAQSIIVAMSGA